MGKYVIARAGMQDRKMVIGETYQFSMWLKVSNGKVPSIINDKGETVWTGFETPPDRAQSVQYSFKATKEIFDDMIEIDLGPRDFFEMDMVELIGVGRTFSCALPGVKTALAHERATKEKLRQWARPAAEKAMMEITTTESEAAKFRTPKSVKRILFDEGDPK